MEKCKYCEDVIKKANCNLCKINLLKDKICLECHKELSHGAIKNQNIVIIGGQSLKINSIDEDIDAFNSSWRNK